MADVPDSWRVEVECPTCGAIAVQDADGELTAVTPWLQEQAIEDKELVAEPGALDPDVVHVAHDAMPPPNHERRLTYRFLTLPFRHQITVTKNLDVLTDADHGLSDEALFQVLFKRAAEKGLLGKLWAETEKLHDDPADFNPFEESK